MGAQKPFHESIVDALNIANDTISIGTLGRLILATVIPKDHRIIRDAWAVRARRAGYHLSSPELFRQVLESVENQGRVRT